MQWIRRYPQFLRLESSMIKETAQWVATEFNIEFVEREPKLLLYPCPSVSYGLEFLSIMMMIKKTTPSPSNNSGDDDYISKTKQLCFDNPQLLVMGIEGGWDTRTNCQICALGDASQAASQANQKIAGDLMASYHQIRNRSKRSK